MQTIDFHAHFFARPFYEALAKASPKPGTPEEKMIQVAKDAGLELPSADLAVHTNRWLSEMKRHDVARMAAFASLPEETAAVAQACRASEGLLIPFAVLNPRAGAPQEVADRAAKFMDEQGLRGFLLFPAMHHYHPGDSALDPLWKALDQRRAIVFAHCGLLVVKLRELFGLPRTIDIAYASPLGLAGVANRHGGIRIVIPHFGAGFLRETLLVGAQCPNVYVDSSSSNSWRKFQDAPLTLAQVFERALEAFGPKRVLFGTDSNTFPAGWRAERRAEQQTALEQVGVSEEVRARIFGANAAALLDGSA